jgi:hypothetical protein
MLITLLVRTSATVYLRLCSLHPTYSPAILTKIAVTDALLVASAFCRVRLSKPVTLTLVRPVQSPVVVVSTPTRSSPAPGSLSSLSLGLNTTPSPAPGPSGPEAPIFGQSSMTLRRESDEMDWEATPTKDPAAWDKFGARQQRMFPQPSASDETGLESLIAGWGISPGSAAAAVGQGSRPSKPLPMAQLAPRAFLDDARVRNLRKLLGALRSLSLLAAVGLRSVGLRISDVAAPALQALLWCEAAASLLALVICLATGPASFFPLAAVVYLCDCGVRASALFATAVPSSLPAEVLAWAGPELACVVWAVFDGLVLLST